MEDFIVATKNIKNVTNQVLLEWSIKIIYIVMYAVTSNKWRKLNKTKQFKILEM